jgi:hypothetical protein
MGEIPPELSSAGRPGNRVARRRRALSIPDADRFLVCDGGRCQGQREEKVTKVFQNAHEAKYNITREKGQLREEIQASTTNNQGNWKPQTSTTKTSTPYASGWDLKLDASPGVAA